MVVVVVVRKGGTRGVISRMDDDDEVDRADEAEDMKSVPVVQLFS